MLFAGSIIWPTAASVLIKVDAGFTRAHQTPYLD
jgi:hypothetical protein